MASTQTHRSTVETAVGAALPLLRRLSHQQRRRGLDAASRDPLPLATMMSLTTLAALASLTASATALPQLGAKVNMTVPSMNNGLPGTAMKGHQKGGVMNQ